MSKKSTLKPYKYRDNLPRCLRFLSNKSSNTKLSYFQAIRKYEEFHGMTIEEAVCEALDEQEQRVPSHQLKVIERIESFQDYLVNRDFVLNSIKLYIGRIKSIYKKNRVDLPYLEEVNPINTRKRDVIEYKDILTKEELRKALQYMRLPAQARLMVMAQGGLSNKECDELSLKAFIDETYKYHQCDDLEDALVWLANPNNPIIWITKIVRVKTGKPYYALIGSEAVNKIAESKLYEMGLSKNKNGLSDKLLDITITSFGRVCRKVNQKCGFGKVAEESKLRPHMIRKFNATNIRGGVLTYEEHILSNSDIDEMQGRGKTSVQDTYIKTNPLQQKLLYAKVMNNVCLFNKYDYELVDDDVIVYRIDPSDENVRLKRQVKDLSKKLEKKKQASQKVQALREELGEDVFREMIESIIGGE